MSFAAEQNNIPVSTMFLSHSVFLPIMMKKKKGRERKKNINFKRLWFLFLQNMFCSLFLRKRPWHQNTDIISPTIPKVNTICRNETKP